MRDDFAIPNMGEAPQNYDKGHINRVVRNVEMTFRTAKSKGPATFTDLTADSLFIASGTATIDKLVITANADISLASTDNPLQIGPNNGANVVMDRNEIMARNNGSASNLFLNADGGAVGFATSVPTIGGILIDGVTVSKSIASQGLVLAGGNNASNGANIELYGGSHATDANKAFYDAIEHTFRDQAATVLRMRVSPAGTSFYDSSGIEAVIIVNDANGGIEIGKRNGSTSTPFVDFHSGAVVTDYDVRLMASGGTGTNGQGRLTVYADDGLALQFGKIRFPATQNPSTDANTLDDYEEGTWTPVLTFATPGDVSVTYASQIGTYIKVGKHVHLQCVINTTAFTHTTSSGSMQVTGLPFSHVSGTARDSTGSLEIQNCTWAGGRTQANSSIVANSAVLRFVTSGSAATRSTITATDHTSGTNILFVSCIEYEATA